MNIDDVADKAQLTLTQEEKETFSDELEDVLEAFSKIEEVDTEDVEKSLQPVQDKRNVLREDTVEDSDVIGLQQTQHTDGDYYLGPDIQ